MKKRKIVLPRNDDEKTKDLDVGMKFELYHAPNKAWLKAEIKFNWNDGSYVIQLDDDDDDHKHEPLTYYIDEYKYRYEDVEDLEPPKKKRKIQEARKKKRKPKKEKPEKAKICQRKTRSKTRPKKRKSKAIRREPNYNRLRIEKLFSNEIENIQDIEDSFMDFSEKIDLSNGLRRLSLESFRAINISDSKLMKTIMKDKKNVADPWINWSCDINRNCLDLAIEQNNVSMIRLLLKYKKKAEQYSKNRVTLRNNESRARLNVSSGFVGKATFGHKVRALKASRGGREGNNAFTKDTIIAVARSMEDHFDFALECGNIQISQLLMNQLHSRPNELISDNGLLYKAAQYGHIHIVQHFVHLLSAQNNDEGKAFGLNKLHVAVVQNEFIDLGEFRNVSITKKALEGNHSITPLHLAAINPNVAYLKQMVEQWHNTNNNYNIVDHTDDLRRTPLFFAAANSNPEPLKYLIECGAKLDVKGLISRDNSQDEISPLLIAIKYGKTHNIKYLLGKTQQERHEIVNESLDNRSNKKLLHVASYYGDANVVAELLEYGANPKAIMKGTRLSALHLAAQRGHLDACRVLTEHRLSIKNKRALLQKDSNKRIPLILAIMNGHLDIVKYMLKCGAPSYTSDSSGNSAIHYAAAYGWNDILKCLMLAPFSKPGVFNMWKLSPFFIAILKGNDLCASTLLDTKDFDVNAVDSEGKSILHYMLESKNSNKTLNHLKRIVVDLGANVNVVIPKTKQTPLHILADSTPSDKDSEMALILMKKGARSDYQDSFGHTPISLAIKHYNFKLIETFIVSFDINLAAKPQKAINWKIEENEREKEAETEAEEMNLNKKLNLNTSLKDSWFTPLIMCIQLKPPQKTPQKPKINIQNKKKQQKLEKKRKQKLLMQHGSNIGGFIGSTFDQKIDVDSYDALSSSSSSSSSSDEKKEEEEKEKERERERNESGETVKQRKFRENRLKIIRLICNALKQYNDNDNLMNIFCKSGANALFYAAQSECYHGTNGYDVNHGAVDIIKLLIEMGADPNCMNHRAETVISYILGNSSYITNIIEILKPIINNANVNKQLIIYDENDEKKIKLQNKSYLTTAINMETILKNETKYNAIKLLIEQGAKLEVENETPAIIQIINDCHKSNLFESNRFEKKYVSDAGNKDDCIAYKLICLLLETMNLKINLNVQQDKKSLIFFVIDLIAKEAQAQQNALYNVINLVADSYHGRDERVINHKKKLYRDRVLAIPLISETILTKMLSSENCKIEINEIAISEAIKLSSLESTLRSQKLFDNHLESNFEALPWRICNLLLNNGDINLNKCNNYHDYKHCNPLIDALNLANKDLRHKMLKLLIDCGININFQDKRGVILVNCMKKYDAESIELLIKNGLNVNNCGWSVCDDVNNDKPNKLSKHPVIELVLNGANEAQNRHKILNMILSQKGIEVQLQNGFCVTVTKNDDLVCCFEDDQFQSVEIEFIQYKYKNQQENKWMLTKTFCVDHLALFAYKSAYQLFKKHYKQNMDKRFSSPLWKQSIEILINCNWSLNVAKNLFTEFKYKLMDAINSENHGRKLIRQTYKRQRKYMAKILKKKGKEKEKENMDVDDTFMNDDDSISNASVSSLDSEERNAINSDDEMKKLEDYKSELKDEIDPEAIKEDDLAPLIANLCANWKYTKQQYDSLVKKWYYAHRELVVGDAAWQLCREQARNNETQRRRDTHIAQRKKQLKHLTDLREELKDTNNNILNEMIRNKAKIPDFAVLDEREEKVKEWEKANKRGKCPLFSESELEDINGVDCTQKVGSQEIKNNFKAQLKTLRFFFAKKNITNNSYYYHKHFAALMKELDTNCVYYCLAHFHDKAENNSNNIADSQSLGYLCLMSSIFNIKHKKNNIFVEIAALKSCKSDALDLIKTYYQHNDDLNVSDKDGKTMIMHAIMNNNLELISWLLSKHSGAEIIKHQSTKRENNILHLLMKHIKNINADATHTNNINIRQLLVTIYDNTKTNPFSTLSAQYNADGYTPLLLALKYLESRQSNKTHIFLDYFEHKLATERWRTNCQKKDEQRENIKKENLDKWYKAHPIDYVEIDLDEIEFKIVCCEWRMINESKSLFDNLNINQQNMLMSSQPISQDEDEEKAIILKSDEDENEEEENATAPSSMNVTKKVKERFVINKQLSIEKHIDLHEIFNTKEWNHKKWILEITYSLGDYFRTVFTEQNKQDAYNAENANIWGFHNKSDSKLTNNINIPQKRDRIKQVYHYRLTNLLQKYKQNCQYILDHLDVKFDGKQHEIYVFLCKKLGIKPRFAYPIARRKNKKKKKKNRDNDDDDDDDIKMDDDNDACYQFKTNINISDAESESDCELPHDPAPVIYDKAPQITQSYSIIDFLSDFVVKMQCKMDQCVKRSNSYKEQMEKEKEESCPKTDDELITMTATQRFAYFERVKKYKLKLWNVTAPWQKKQKHETKYTGFSPLHFATLFGDFDLLKLFVSFKTNPNLVTDEKKQTALMIHCNKRNDTKMVHELFKDDRCDVNLADIEGFTALIYAINFSGRHLHDSERLFRETFQIERILLNHNANINHNDVYGRSAAHYIFVSLRAKQCFGSRDPIELVSDLCSCSTNVANATLDVNIRDMFGRTPIAYAAMVGAQISSNWLTKEGAKIIGCADYYGNEPFQHSIINKQIALSVDYINQGVDVKHMLWDYNNGYEQRSSFRQCLELKWMGVAYLMVSRGVEITLAVQDALETENYQLAKTLLYKTKSINLHHRTPDNKYNLHHIVSKYHPNTLQSKKAFEDPWSVRIVEILDEHNVKSKGILDKFGMTPLHYAVQNGHCSLAKYYITVNKLDAERLNGIQNERSLISALYNNDINMVQMLVESIGVNVENKLSKHNTRKDGNIVAIHIAATKNNMKAVQILLDARASTKIEYEYKNRLRVYKNGDRTIIHTAIRRNNYELTKLLIEHKADVDSTLFYDDLRGYYTCLHLACCKRNIKIIKLLIEYKCNVNELMRYSAIKPLDKSPKTEKEEKKEVARWRKEFKTKHEFNGLDECALHIVCRKYNDYDLTKLLIEYGANVNKMYRKKLLLDRHQNRMQLRKLFNISTLNDLPDLCLLHTCVRNRNYRMVQLLLQNGADTNQLMCKRVEHKYGELTCLHTAVINDDDEMVQLLLNAKPKQANANQLYTSKHCKNSDLSPLHTAIRNENGEMVKLLLKSGADPNERMIAANSANGELFGIHIAVLNENIEITRHLLKHGADPDKVLNTKRTKYGDTTCLHLATRFRNYSLTELLLLYGADTNAILRPKKENEIIWKWSSDSGYKEYDDILNILIEKQYQLYLDQKEAKKKYLDGIKESNKNLINKKKADAEQIAIFDTKIREKSIFYLRCGSFFESHENEEYFVDFSTFRQNKKNLNKYREVLRYKNPFDIHKSGGSALQIAVRNKDLHIVSLLVNYHCNMNVTNKVSETSLIYAIKENDLTLAAILMRGAIFYNNKHKERIFRAIERRKRNNNNNKDKIIKNTKKRARDDDNNDDVRIHKKRKISLSKYANESIENENKFIPIDVCLRDDKHGFSALHCAVLTDGMYNASFENETMLQLLVNRETLRTNHFLETKVDALTPFKSELSSEELKDSDTQFIKPYRFKSTINSIDINVRDNDNNSAAYYSLLQKSGKMTKCLQDLGARIPQIVKEKAKKALLEKEENEKRERLKCLTQMYDSKILHSSYDILSDARKWRKEFFIEEDEEEEDDDIDAEEIEVDFPAKREIGKKAYVYSENRDIFNWDGIYVNVDKGKYGAYMFYKLQILYKPIQSMYILWCRWGRPGETGNFQRTPYDNKQDAIKEFKKIFESKTLNKFEDRFRNKFVPKKWRMIRKKRRRHKIQKEKEKEKMHPHNLVNSIKEILRTLPKPERPKAKLPQEIAEFIHTIFDTAALNCARRAIGIQDSDSLGYVSDKDLDSMYELIQKISTFVKQQEDENIKRKNLENNKYKLEKQINERNTKRERNKNLFLRNEQRLKQEIQRLNILITKIKSNKDDSTQLEEEEKEKKNERKLKQDKLCLITEEEKKRINDEKTIFDPFDTENRKEIEEINGKLTELNKICQERKKRISHLSNEFYVLMTRDEFADTYITAIDNQSLVNKYLRMMMYLNEHQMAISALMGAQYRYLKTKPYIHPVDYCYISLKCKIIPLLPHCYDFKLILSYMNRTAAPVIHEKNVNIYEIWKDEEEEEEEEGKYETYENQMLLWHGSDTANVCGILSRGLKIAPPEADATGYMFGKGVYFADAFRKSKNYASTGNRRNSSNLKCLFLCKVALGKMYEAITSEYMEQAKPSFHSTKGLGAQGPDPSHVKTNHRGAIIPDSPTINYPERTTRDKDNNIVSVPFFLHWNEYVIYNEQQAKLKYLIMLK